MRSQTAREHVMGLHSDETAARGHALVFLGATNGLGKKELSLLRTNVVDAVPAETGPSESFAVLKCTDHDGKLCTDAAEGTLWNATLSTLQPVAASLVRGDDLGPRFRNTTHLLKPALECMMGVGVHRKPFDAAIRMWSTMEWAMDMVERRELVRKRQFQSLLTVRVNVAFATPVGMWLPQLAEPNTWYTAVEPPDAVWLLPRWLAGYAMRTLSGFVDAAARKACRKPTEYAMSWFIPCYWSTRFWESLPPEAPQAVGGTRAVGGLRVRFTAAFNGSVPIHAHGGFADLAGCPARTVEPQRGAPDDVLYSDEVFYCKPWDRAHLLDPPHVPRGRMCTSHCMHCERDRSPRPFPGDNSEQP